MRGGLNPMNLPPCEYATVYTCIYQYIAVFIDIFIITYMLPARRSFTCVRNVLFGGRLQLLIKHMIFIIIVKINLPL